MEVQIQVSNMPDTAFWQFQFLGMTHSQPARTLNDALTASMFCGVRTLFNTTTFLLNSWAGLFTVVYPHLYGTRWRHFTVSMNPEFFAKFTLGGNVAIVVLIKWSYSESMLCTSPWLHFNLNAIHGHATWQHHSPSPLMLKIEKRCYRIAWFTGRDPVLCLFIKSINLLYISFSKIF
jgi:hypothetical protein